MSETTTTKSTGKRGRPPGNKIKKTTPAIDPGVEQKILSSKSNMLADEGFISAEEIINRASGRVHEKIDLEDVDAQYGNVIENDPGITQDSNTSVEDLFDNAQSKGVKPIPLDALDAVAAASVPSIRKVVIRKINRFVFKLGLEKQKEGYSMFPGTGHTFACDKKGDEFITGFDLLDEEGNQKYAKDKKRLENALRIDLGPKSPFWATLTFRMEDKKHGMILNFDDTAMGAHNEAVYFAMLGSSLIANGFQEYATSVKPAAEWYIENKEAEAELKQKAISIEQRAFIAFGESSNNKRRGIGKLLGLPVWGAGNNVVDSLVWDYLKGVNATGEKAENPTKNCENFLKVYNQGEVEFQTRVAVRDGIKLNVIRKNRLGQLSFGDVDLGPSEDTAVSRLVLPQNAAVLRVINSTVVNKS